MEYRLGHKVVYDTPGPVPVTDVIESLRGAVQITAEIGPLLEALCPGLEVQRITLQVDEISQHSPLTDSFVLAVLVVFQDSIQADVHYALNNLFQVHIDKHYENLVSVVFLILVFFAGKSMYEGIKHSLERSKIKMQLSGLIKDVAEMLGREEAEVKKLIEDKYGKSGLKNLFDATHRFLAPSKNQGNAPILVNKYAITHEVVAEFPTRAQAEIDDIETSSYPMENVEIELHAQDMDHGKQGWAAIVPQISRSRISMQLYPPIKPSDIYTRTHVRGDIIVETKINKNGERQPARIHLIRLLD